MSASLLHAIAELTAAASVAILIVAAVRKPLRWVGGVRVGYLVWWLVPASQLVVLLPAPSQPLDGASQTIPQLVLGAVPAAMPSEYLSAGVDYAVTSYGALAVIVWAAGSLLMLLFVVRRQRAFARSLGVLKATPDGTYRSSTVRGPLLVGAWRPRVILPADFESLYDAEERALVLAHEQAHRERGDALVNVVATIWLCLSWFNPLMYWAVARLRFDQELACDAVVLAPRATLRRRYAAALLRTQLAAEAGPPVPIGCAWQSVHPLKERIAMLKRPLPTTTRRFSASMLTCATLVAGSYVAWTALPRVAYAQSDPHRVTLTADRLVASRAGDYELSGNVVLRSTAPGTGLNARKSPFEPQVLGLEDEDVSSAPRVGPLRSVPRGGPLRYVYTIMEWRGEVPPPFQVEVDVGRVSRETDGSAQLEGPIRISFAPGGLLTTDRATIAADGTIRMDSARFTRTAQAQ